ncbi:hypothetical protein GLOIN_2v1877169 [Rhizophagus clarus]|uniref:TLDc domain-containing protein n=1 Tax=Rhizophagus clarus TaxID=94130 RepID=A0A8H3QSJ8_9GLOM|nr:hypothetical protein GLOIN_2v1877169 [Rhizophagus clarus]
MDILIFILNVLSFRYIYGGFISLDEQEPLEILKLLVAADQLLLQELIIDYLQEYLIENKSEWMEQYFELVYQTIRPYKKLLNHQLYEELLNSYLNSNSKPNDDILLPRYRKVDGIVHTKIVNLNIVSLVSRWIDKIDIKSKFAYTREIYLPYEFKLLLRGSRDGFTPKTFHELCNNKLCTVTFIKIKGTEEIIGGYNPLDKNDFKDPILSHVKYTDYALFCSKDFGPTFGNDIKIFANKDDLEEYDHCWYIQKSYEKKIRNTKEFFFMEDYKVFQIIKKND